MTKLNEMEPEVMTKLQYRAEQAGSLAFDMVLFRKKGEMKEAEEAASDAYDRRTGEGWDEMSETERREYLRWTSAPGLNSYAMKQICQKEWSTLSDRARSLVMNATPDPRP